MIVFFFVVEELIILVGLLIFVIDSELPEVFVVVFELRIIYL
jgi:hypothetical protein